jgi:hypothetical protein
MGAMISALVSGVPFDDVTASSFWQWGELHPEVAGMAAGDWKGKKPPVIRGTGYCIAALEAALWAVAGAEDFAAAVLRAANLGDDADTTAAIAGQIAGARWGASAIPRDWRDKVVAGARIEALARGLFLALGGEDLATRWPHDEFLHAWWVEPGRLLAGEYPGHPDAIVARRKVDLLVDCGIRTFVDLTSPADGLERYGPIVDAVAAARRLDLRRVSFPIPDVDVVDDEAYDTVTAAIEGAVEHGGVFVHCWGGVGRTATVVGCLLADRGLEYPAILERLDTLRRDSRKADRAAPEAPSQFAVIERRAARRHR